MATYALNPNGLLDSGMELEGVTRSIENSLTELNQYVARYIQENTGGTAESFRAAQQQWEQGMREMNAALAVGKQKLDAIVENYHLADVQGAALFGGNV
ncbi:MAG: WXG100 family type VII secretion target [Micromonosporaceae bacterium]